MGAFVFLILIICLGIFLNFRALKNNGGCYQYIEATIVSHEYESGDGESYPSHYKAYYEYTVGDETYKGVEYRSPYGRYIKKKEEIEELFPIGSTIGVYINPDRPEYSSLEAGGNATDNFNHAGMIVAGLVFLGFFMVMFLRAAAG